MEGAQNIARKETNLEKPPYTQNSIAKSVYTEEEWTAATLCRVPQLCRGTIARDVGRAFRGMLTVILNSYVAAEKR